VKGKVAAPVNKSENMAVGDRLRWPRDTLYSQKLVLISPTSGGRSVGIVRSRTKATEFGFLAVSGNCVNIEGIGSGYTEAGVQCLCEVACWWYRTYVYNDDGGWQGEIKIRASWRGERGN
jgi:hypothetical protein